MLLNEVNKITVEILFFISNVFRIYLEVPDECLPKTSTIGPQIYEIERKRFTEIYWHLNYCMLVCYLCANVHCAMCMKSRENQRFSRQTFEENWTFFQIVRRRAGVNWPKPIQSRATYSALPIRHHPILHWQKMLFTRLERKGWWLNFILTIPLKWNVCFANGKLPQTIENITSCRFIRKNISHH